MGVMRQHDKVKYNKLRNDYGFSAHNTLTEILSN